MQPSKDIGRLLEIMAALRTPRSGCPWDLQQTHKSLAPYALEEAYELVEAIERGEMSDLCDELGDLLLQVVFHARLAEEAGAFDFKDVVAAVTAKMVRRHPHVFSPEARGEGPKSGVDKIWQAMRARRELRLGEPEARPGHGGLLAAMAKADDKVNFSNETWEAIKAQERAGKGKGASGTGLLAEVATALPGLTRAMKLQKKAATVGFDWADAKLVLAKIREEVDEIEQAMTQQATATNGTGEAKAVEEEIGDLLFAVVNLARHAAIDPETAIRGTNHKFERRFAFIEETLVARGSSLTEATLQDMDGLWNEAKSRGL